MDGICVSVVGMVDVERKRIFYPTPLIPDYAGTRIKARVEPESSLPREVESGVNCAGLSEVISGAAAGSRFTPCLTVGARIGGCIIIDGNVHHDSSNSTCRVGCMHVEGSSFQILGTANILASKVALAKGELVHMWNGLRIFELTKTRDSVYIQAVDDICGVLRKGISNICYVIDPQVVVLGEGVVVQEKYLWSRIQATMDRYLVSNIREETTLAFAQHRNDAEIRGVCCHFKEKWG